MTTASNYTTTLRNTNDTHGTLITINVAAQTPLKLTSTNYLSWKLQFETLFVGYDLLGFITGSNPCPTPNISTDTSTSPNPAYSLWIRQENLILNAIIGSMTPTLISFVAKCKTSQEAWSILANTYAKPSRGKIKQVKSQLKNMTKGAETITEFLQKINCKADELALLGAPFDNEDITDLVLAALGDEFKELACTVQARDTPISFEELHEKLLNFEAFIQAPKTEPVFPITAHVATRNNSSWCNNYENSTHPNQHQTRNPNPNRQQHPYRGFSQLCRVQGHTAKRCPSYKLQPVSTNNSSFNPPWQPKANFAATSSKNQNQPWLLDSGASHHVTFDLEHLSLHNPYGENDDMMIGDGTAIPITHTGTDHRNCAAEGSS